MTGSQMLGEMIQSLRDELKSLQTSARSGQTEHALYRGVALGTFDGAHVYRFQPSPSVSFAAGVTVTVDFGGEYFQGHLPEATILRADGKDVVLSIFNQPGAEKSHVSLRADPGNLPAVLISELKRLQKSVDQADVPDGRPFRSLLNGLFPGNEENSSPPDDHWDLSALVAKAFSQELCFAWSPAGTDSAGFVAACADEARKRGLSVEVLDPTTTGVDEATLAWVEANHLSKDSVLGDVVRVGSPELAEARALAGLAPFAAARHCKPELFATLDSLDKRITDLSNAILYSTKSSKAAMDALFKEKSVLESEMWAMYEAVIRDAKLRFACLGATLFHSTLCDLQSDVVIVNHVHRAWLPQIVVAASRARKHVILVGDFRQPAVSIKAKTEDAERWLKANVFEAAGITAKVNRGDWDSRLLMLRTQHTMHPRISRIVSEASYGGRLIDAPEVAERTSAITLQPPEPGVAVTFYDVAHLLPHANLANGGSHSNVLTAALSLSVTRMLLGQRAGSALIATPYGDQGKIHRALMRDAELEANVTTTTLHRCVHEPHDLVILDLVDTAPSRLVGFPLQGTRSSELMRQLTAAFSSGCGKIAVLGDQEFLRQTLPDDSALGCFLKAMRRNGAVFKPFPVGLLRPATHKQRPGVSYYTEPDQAWPVIYQDIAAASHRVIWNWPFANVSEVFNEQSLPLLLPVKVKRALATSMPNPVAQVLQLHGVTLADAMSTAACVQIDDGLFWYLGATASSGQSRPFIRVHGEQGALQISDLFGLNEIISSRRARPRARKATA